MSNDVLITPASRKIEFKDSSANVDAKIETDASGNLIITNTGGDISIGDTTSDIFVGDGTANVDIVFEQSGEIRGETGVTVTLGQSDSSIRMGTDLNLNSNDITNVGDLTVNNLTVNGTTTTVSSVNTTVTDSLIELNSGLTGSNSKDIGFIFERGSTGHNAAFFWDESADRFRFITTTNTGSATTIADNITEGSVQAGSFYGNGAGITSLNGSNISSGTVAAARIANLDASKITSGTLGGARIATGSSGDWWSGNAVKVGTDGVMEIGKYIDFHNADAGTSDYTARITNSGDHLYATGRIYVNDNQRVFADNYHPNADVLTTARTINGVSFNGSANITVADSTKLPLAGGTMTGALNAGGGITGLTLSNGIAGNNFNITGVNQLSINDPGEGISFGGGSNTVTLFAIDDSSDNIMNFSGAAELRVNNSKVFHDGYHPNADTWTTARTITLGGDLTGNVSINGSANVTLTATVADDSHNHVLANVDRVALNSGQNLNDYNTQSIISWGSSQPTNGPGYAYATGFVLQDNNQPQQLVQVYGGNANKVKLYGRRKTSGSWDSTWTQYFSDHYHPNADTLTTARTIAGTSFNGSANIDINYNNLTNKPTIPSSSSFVTLTGNQTISGIKTHSSQLALSAGQMLSLGDTNHHLVKVSTGYSGSTVDGPRLQGHQGGELATNYLSNQYSLRWDSAGNIHVRGDGKFNGTKIEGDGKEIVRFSDSWLRLNPDNDFSSGIYAGTGILRTDGTFQVGAGGSQFAVNASSGNVTLAGTLDGRDIAADGTKLDTIATNANYITNNNQLTNGAGYITDGNTNWNNTYGFITSSDSSITNKLPLAGGTMTGNLEVGGSIQATSTGTATLTLRGDSNNSGDTGQLDSTIKMLHDDGTHGILMETKNYAGKQSFEIKSLSAGIESSRFLIHEDNYIVTSGGIRTTSTADATPAIIATNTGGINGVIQRWIGETDSMELRNMDTGDYELMNTQQNNGIIFRDGTGGVEIHYNGNEIVEVGSLGGLVLYSGALQIPSNLQHKDDSDTYINFTDDRVQIYAGGSSKFDTNVPYLKKGTDIPGSANLNTYISAGFYHQNSNSNAGSGSNYPTGSAGMLTVTADGVMVYQTYHQYNGTGYYHRSYYNGTWYGWRQVFNDNYHPNADTLTTARTINGVSFNGSANITVADSTKLPLAGGTMTGDITISNSSPALNLVDSNSFSDANDRFVYRAADNRVRWEWYDNSAGTTTTVLDLDSTGLLKTDDLRLNANHTLQRSNHHSGHLEGSYNNIGDNATKSNPIYTIGSAYNPVDASLSNMYGIGFSHTNASFVSFTGASNWGLYVAADGDARVWLGASNGVISSTGEHYVGTSRVFHDTYHPNADTLTTARTIGGVSFNGSANINLPGVNTAGNQNTSGTAAGLSGTPNITVGTISSGHHDISTTGTGNGLYVYGGDSSGQIKVGAYTRITGATASNTGAFSFNANYTGGQTNEWIPDYAGAAAAGMFVLRQDSGGIGSASVYVKNSGTTSSAQALSTFTKVAQFHQDGYFSTPAGLRVGSTEVLTSSRNLTNIGTISAGFTHLYKTGSGQTIVAVIGSDSTRPVLQFSESTATSITAGMSIEYNGTGSGATNYMSINAVTGASMFQFSSGGDFRIGSTTVIDSSRNLTNIGTIASGVITATNSGNAIVAKYNASNYSALRYDGVDTVAGGDGVYKRGGSEKLRLKTSGVDVTGTMTASADVVAYSDERLKTNVKTLDGKKALQMRGVSFEKDGVQSSGVIAQEIEKIAPELVHTSDDEIKTKSVAYGNLVGYLIEAVKEQQEQINKLIDRINDLEKGE